MGFGLASGCTGRFGAGEPNTLDDGALLRCLLHFHLCSDVPGRSRAVDVYVSAGCGEAVE